ncbi:hypothetical protein ACWC9T_31705 [Kitasatospora sp. NPDC001159]
MDWYVEDELVHADLRGVGTGWHAYLIVNLSVADGTHHDRPLDGPSRLSWVCRGLQVER